MFDSWIRKIRWRRDRLPTPVFLGFPGGSAGKEEGGVGNNSRRRKMVAGTDFQRKLCIWGGEVWSSGKEGRITRLLGRGSEDDRGKMPQKMRGFMHLSTNLCGQHDRPGKDILTVTSEGKTAGRAHVLVCTSCCPPSCPRDRGHKRAQPQSSFAGWEASKEE